jgi:Glycosyl hydrolases family 32 N-terminal domain/PAN domain/Glycosyl hydrolases family 32 C terminal
VSSMASLSVQGGMWECPDLFAASGGAWVAKVSSNGRDWFTVGSFDAAALSFAPQYPAQLADLHQGFYASKSFFDAPNARQILYGWVQEGDANYSSRGWASINSLPRALDVVQVPPSFAVVTSNPIPELAALRSLPALGPFSPAPLPPGAVVPIPTNATSGQQLEVVVTFSLPPTLQEHVRLVAARQSSSSSLRDNHPSPSSSFPPHLWDLPAVTYGVFVQGNGSASSANALRVSITHSFPTSPENNTDRPGGDYRDYGLNATDGDDYNIANCSAQCALESLCAAWTYVRPGGPGAPEWPVPRCSLKSSIPATNPNVWCVSGLPGSFLVSHDTSDVAGNGYRSVEAAPIPVAPQEAPLLAVDLRVFVDHSITESFTLGGRVAGTSRVYAPPQFFNAGVYSAPGAPLNESVAVQSLQAYALRSVNF